MCLMILKYNSRKDKFGCISNLFTNINSILQQKSEWKSGFINNRSRQLQKGNIIWGFGRYSVGYNLSPVFFYYLHFGKLAPNLHLVHQDAETITGLQ